MKSLSSLVTTSVQRVNNIRQFTFKFAFDSRESYLEFRQTWRRRYADVSGELRDLKEAIKREQKLRQSTSQSVLVDNKKIANELCEMRVQSKIVSGEQRKAQTLAGSVIA